MGGGAGLLACTRGARNGVDGHVLGEQSHLGSRQQGHLNGCGKTSGVGHVLRLDNLGLVDFRQSVDVVVVALNAEVLREVDNLDAVGDGVLLQERFALAVTETEEDNVYLIEWHLVGKTQISVTNQSFVHVADQIAGIALRVGEDNLCLGVVQQ